MHQRKALGGNDQHPDSQRSAVFQGGVGAEPSSVLAAVSHCWWAVLEGEEFIDGVALLCPCSATLRNGSVTGCVCQGLS